MYCGRCRKKMKHIISFERSRNVDYYKCPACGLETKKFPYVVENFTTKTEKEFTAKMRDCNYENI